MEEDDTEQYARYAAEAFADPECRANTGAWTALMGVVEDVQGELTGEEVAVPILHAVYEVLHETCGMSHEQIIAVVDKTYGRGVSPE